MLITLLAPEIVTGIALEQLINALRIRHRLQNDHCSMTQAFYIVSGGIRIQRKCQPAKAVNPLQASWGREFELSRYLPAKEELQDKSKANGLVKGLTILQVGWFVVQTIARVHHRLPISELELGTIAFVACTTMS